MKKKTLKQFSGFLNFLMGEDLNTKSLSSIHSFYFSVNRSFPPSLSCSVLKVLITTPTKRFKKKKAPTTVNTTKNMTQIKLYVKFGSGTSSKSLA